MKYYPLIVAGSRTWKDKDIMLSALREFHRQHITPLPDTKLEIVSGHARGADQLGEFIAKRHNIKLKVMPADWGTHGVSAGYRRNKEMAIYAASKQGGCIVFWDGQSRGSNHMINLARQYGLTTVVIKPEQA